MTSKKNGPGASRSTLCVAVTYCQPSETGRNCWGKSSGTYSPIELQYQVFPLHCDGSPTGFDLEIMGWCGRIMEGFAHQPYNVLLGAAAEIEDLLKSAGFVNVHRRRFQRELHPCTSDQRKKIFSENVREILLEGLDAYSRRPFLRR